MKQLREIDGARGRAQERTYTLVEPLLSAERRAQLDGLLKAKASNSWSTLKWLGHGASGESPGSIKSEVAKLAFLRQLGAHEWDLSDLNPKLCVLLPPQLPPYQPSRMSFNILSVRGLSARIMNFGGVNRGLLLTFCSLSSARLKYRICSLPTI